MLQRLKIWAGRVIHQGQREADADSLSVAEELDDLDKWRNGHYGWVAKAGKPGPYLQYVRGLTALSKHHDLLADFMDAGTIPSRWDPNEPGGYPPDIASRGCLTNRRASDRAKAERMRRTHVCLLEYPKDSSEVRSRTSKSPEELRSLLSSLQVDASLKLRLFVVEDLSVEF